MARELVWGGSPLLSVLLGVELLKCFRFETLGQTVVSDRTVGRSGQGIVSILVFRPTRARTLFARVGDDHPTRSSQPRGGTR